MPRQRGIWGKTPGSGRQKGTPNKITTDLRDAAGKYTAAALQTLQSIMSNPKNPAAARVQAAAELLNRGHGRPHATQEIALNDVRGFVRAPQKLEPQEWKELLERRQAAAELVAPKPKPKPLEAKPNGNSTPKLN